MTRKGTEIRCSCCGDTFTASRFFFDDNGNVVVRRPVCPDCSMSSIFNRGFGVIRPTGAVA